MRAPGARAGGSEAVVSMRTLEIATAIVLIGLSISFMMHAIELPIGWVDGQGPGGGAFPFWLSLLMLVCASLVLVREIAGRGRQPGEAFMEREAALWLGAIVGLLLLGVAAIHIVGMFVAIPIFLLLYLRVFGRHSWRLILPVVILTPIGMFLFFEVTLRILLPKGITAPWFTPLYGVFF